MLGLIINFDLKLLIKVLCIAIPVLAAFVMWVLLTAQSKKFDNKVMSYDYVDDDEDDEDGMF